MKMYIDDLALLTGLKQGPKDLMILLARKIDFDGMITLTARSRKAIAESMGVADQTFRNYLGQLVKSDMLRRIGQNEYEVNPHFFARGEWKEIYQRRENFVMKVTYTPEGERQITTETEPTDDPSANDEAA